MRDPVIVHAWLTSAVSLGCMALIAYHAWATRRGRRDLLAAFRLRWVARLGSAAPLLLFVSLVSALISSPPQGGAFVAVLGVALPLLSVWFSWQLALGEREAIFRTLRLAEGATTYERLQVCEYYAMTYPEDPAPLLPLLDDPASMRVAARMVEGGAQVDGRPLAEVIIERLEEGDRRDLIERALECGVFRHDPALEARARELLRGAGMVAWDAILSRSADAPRVGDVLRRVLEDAITFQADTLHVVMPGRELPGSTPRMALSAFKHGLADHLEQVHLKLAAPAAPSLYTQGVVALDAVADDDALPWSIELESLDVKLEQLVWYAYESVPVPRPVWATRGNAMGVGDPDLVRGQQIKRVLKRTPYPVMRLRVTVKRDGRVVRTIEADTSPGLHAVKRDDKLKRGNRPALVAAELLLRTMVQGLGLRVFDVEGEERARRGLAAALVTESMGSQPEWSARERAREEEASEVVVSEVHAVSEA